MNRNPAPTQKQDNNVKVFRIDMFSAIDNMKYEGTFKTKKLSIRENAAIAVRKVQLNGGMHYSAQSPGQGVAEETDNVNGILAFLEVSIVESPPWWNLDKISDMDVVLRVWREVMEFQNSFHLRGLTPSATGDNSERGSSAEISNPNNTGVSPALVDQEIFTSLEP